MAGTQRTTSNRRSTETKRRSCIARTHSIAPRTGPASHPVASTRPLRSTRRHRSQNPSAHSSQPQYLRLLHGARCLRACLCQRCSAAELVSRTPTDSPQEIRWLLLCHRWKRGSARVELWSSSLPGRSWGCIRKLERQPRRRACPCESTNADAEQADRNGAPMGACGRHVKRVQGLGHGYAREYWHGQRSVVRVPWPMCAPHA